jgi:hypothetical protein
MAISHLENLHELSVSGSLPTNGHPLFNLSRLSGLEVLNIANNFIQADDIAALSEFPSLNALDVSGTPISKELIQELKKSHVKFLTLKGCLGLNHALVQELSELQLTQLVLTHADISPSDLILLVSKMKSTQINVESDDFTNL